MAFAKHTYNPVTHRGGNAVAVHLTSFWDEEAASSLGYHHGTLQMGTRDIEDALLVANRINTTAYELEYSWRQSLRERREVPLGLKIATNTEFPDFQAAYVIIGQDLFFTGVGKRKGWTVRYAERFIDAICEDDNLDSNVYTFHDVQVIHNYDQDTYCYELNRLVIENTKDYFRVDFWETEALSPYNRSGTLRDDLPGIPPEVLEVFYDFMFFQGKLIDYKPEFFGSRLPLEEVLVKWDELFQPIDLMGQKGDKPPADLLYDRILIATGENVGYITDESQREIYSIISQAFPVIAYPYFSETQQHVFLYLFRLSEKDPEHQEYLRQQQIPLTPEQAEVLSRVAAKAGIPFDPNQLAVSLIPILDELEKHPEE